MKKFITIHCLFLIIFQFAVPAFAARKASVRFGKELYADPHLAGSTNEKSCLSCHKADDKKMLKKVRKMSKEEVSQTVNRCIVGALKGKALDSESEEMRALRMYLTFLTNDCYE